MASVTTSIFNGQLQPTGTNTDTFTNADYALIITPTLQDDISIDAFLQLELDNQQRLIPLSPVNVLDNNFITLIPRQFTVGNQFNLYMFVIPSEPINAEILIVNNNDDRIDEILSTVKSIEQEQDIVTDVIASL